MLGLLLGATAEASTEWRAQRQEEARAAAADLAAATRRGVHVAWLAATPLRPHCCDVAPYNEPDACSSGVGACDGRFTSRCVEETNALVRAEMRAPRCTRRGCGRPRRRSCSSLYGRPSSTAPSWARCRPRSRCLRSRAAAASAARACCCTRCPSLSRVRRSCAASSATCCAANASCCPLRRTLSTWPSCAAACSADAAAADAARGAAAGEPDRAEALLRSAAPLLAGGGGGGGGGALGAGKLSIKRVSDLNVAAPSHSCVSAVQWHPNAQLAIAAGLDKTFHLFRVDGAPRPLCSTPRASAPRSSRAPTPTSRYRRTLATGDDNTQMQAVHVPRMQIRSAAFTADGGQVLVCGEKSKMWGSSRQAHL